MLIYVNNFTLVNEGLGRVLDTVVGWLKGFTGTLIPVESLLSGLNSSYENGVWVRSYSSVDFEPLMYSVMVSHPDRSVRGRLWVTEIGIKVENGTTSFSLKLETSEVSTQVRELPISTRPKLVQFLFDNDLISPLTIGMSIKRIRDNRDDLISFYYEVNRKERKYPIVLVSCNHYNGKPFVDINILQEYLVGLAEVCFIESSVCSWSMEEELTKNYSAWDGSINIIFPCYNNKPYNKVIFKDEISKFKSNIDIIRNILSIVTHSTNIARSKLHFSPTDLRAKRQKDQLLKLKEKLSLVKNNEDYPLLLEAAFKEIEESKNILDEMEKSYIADSIEYESRINILTDENHNLKSKIHYLSSIKNNGTDSALRFDINNNEFYDGEFGYFLNKIAKSYISSNELSITSRIYTLVNEIISSTDSDRLKSKEKQRELKSIFTNYNGNVQNLKSRLLRLGFDVLDDGDHNKIVFSNDRRTGVTFAKTPSDGQRVGGNIYRDIKKEFF